MALPSSSTSETSLIRLDRGFRVDEVINTRKKHIVIIRFGNEAHPACKEVDEWLEEEAKRLNEKDAVVYTVQNKNVPELVARFELSYDAAATVMFFLENTLTNILAGADVIREKFKQTVSTLLQRRNNSTTHVKNGSHDRQSHERRLSPILPDVPDLDTPSQTGRQSNFLVKYFKNMIG